MIITKIEIQKKNKDRASIYIDDEFAFGVHVNVVYDLGLKKGMEIDDSFRNEILSKEETKQAHLYALKIINYRPRCESEVRHKMSEKGYAPDTIDETIDYLYEYNFLDDEAFARYYIESKLEKKFGLNRIKYGLTSMGVSRDIADSVINSYRDTTDEYSTALSLAEKRLATLQDDDYQKKYQKLSGFLSRKGYSSDIIHSILRDLLSS